jgi:hypothetical protein
LNEIKTLYAFIEENGEYYRGDSFNNPSIRVWYSQKDAMKYVSRYRKPDKPPLTLVKLTSSPIYCDKVVS